MNPPLPQIKALAAELDRLRATNDALLARIKAHDYPFPGDVREFLRSEAASRNVSVPDLVRSLVEVVARDNLFAAVLDG